MLAYMNEGLEPGGICFREELGAGQQVGTPSIFAGEGAGPALEVMGPVGEQARKSWLLSVFCSSSFSCQLPALLFLCALYALPLAWACMPLSGTPSGSIHSFCSASVTYRWLSLLGTQC